MRVAVVGTSGVLGRALVAILESAARSLRKGRWLVLHQPPPMVRRILDLLWPEGESTIAIKDEE